MLESLSMMATDVTNWITAIASTITALTIILIWKQVKADHERSRREKAIEIMQFWTNKPRPPLSFTPIVKFVEQLNENQCECLHKIDPFEVGKELENELITCLIEFSDHVIHNKNTDKILLGKKDVIMLRWLAASYLNTLETVATAWRHNVADRDIIEEEFESIVSPKKNRFVLETYRRVTGIYPSIAEFAEAIKQKQNRRVSKKSVV